MSTTPAGTPTWEELDSQFDYYYNLPRPAAEALRKAGVPPPPPPADPAQRAVRDELIRRQAEYAAKQTAGK